MHQFLDEYEHTALPVDVKTDASVVKVIAALITLSFQRRDQRRAARSEIRTPSDIRDDGHVGESIKSIDTEKRTEKGVP